MIRYTIKHGIKPLYKIKRSYYGVSWYASPLSILSSHLLVDYGSNKDQSSTHNMISNVEFPRYIATQFTEDSKKVKKSYQMYSYELIQRIYHTMQYINRIFAYIFYGTPMIILTPATIAFGRYIPGLEDIVWDYCLWSIVQLGPTFIKLAQWASTRPDLFPPKLVERLQSLQDHVRVSYNFNTVERTLNDAFGENWKETIEIDPKPIGAGCVAQVFRGILRSSSVASSSSSVASSASSSSFSICDYLFGKSTSSKTPLDSSKPIQVAIKMIHPHVESVVSIDMELLSMFAHWLDRFPSLEMLNLGQTLTEFGDMMQRQLDLRNEAYNLKTFGKKFKDDSWALFPAPIDGYVRKNVMVETLMEGSSIVNYMALQPVATVMAQAAATGYEDISKLKLKLSDLGCRLILKMVFFDNFVHGDLHPGNILVNFDENGEPHLVILDCGIVYQAKTAEEHQRLVDICFAFMQHDGRKAGRLMVEKGRKGEEKHAEAFCEAVHQMIVESEGQGYFEHLGEYIAKLCDLARIYAVKLDPGYFAIAMALKVVEGVSLALNHDLDMVSKCVPIIVKARALRALGIEKFPLPDKEEFEKEVNRMTNSKKLAVNHNDL